MSKLMLAVYLSEKGMKADLLAGGPGKDRKEFEVPREHPDFAALLEYASPCSEGFLLSHAYGHNSDLGGEVPRYDAPPTPGDVLAQHRALLKKAADEKEADLTRKREATLAVLRERKTTMRGGYVTASKEGQTGQANYSYPVADWPSYYNLDDTIVGSDEAKEWLAELEVQAQAAREAARPEAEADADKKVAAAAAARVAKEEAAARHAAFRKEMGLKDGEEAYRVEDGALVRVPCWESHKRGKNWMATIRVDPKKPGGFDRDFFEKAKGDSYYIMPSSLEPGTPIEFGADYYSGGSGRRSEERWHGFVVRIVAQTKEKPGYLILHKCASGKDAVAGGKKFAEAQAKPKKSRKKPAEAAAEEAPAAQPESTVTE